MFLSCSLFYSLSSTCVCSLAPAVTLPPVFSTLRLPPSCSSGIFPWANRKQQQLVMRPPVPAPPTAFLSTTGDTSLFQMFTSTHTYPTSATHCVLVSSCYKFAYSLQKQTHILSCCLRLSLLDWNYNAEVKCLLTLV